MNITRTVRAVARQTRQRLAAESRATPTPAELSRQFRQSDDPSLARRRKIVGLCLVASGMMGVVALYQTGLVRRLPDPPIKGLDSMKVNASEEAYGILQVPDSLLGLGSYATTAALAAMGGVGRARRGGWVRWLPLALGAKATLDAGQAGKLTWDQWARHRAFCIYCLVAAAATFAILPLAWRDVAGSLARGGPRGR